MGDAAAYRANQRADDELVALACDRQADADLRAAAAHVVLATGDEDAIARAVDVLGERTPPVVVIAAALAAPERVGVAVLEQALEVIAPDEEREARAELAAMRAPAAAHVRVAVPEVVEEFDDEEPEANARRMRKVN